MRELMMGDAEYDEGAMQNALMPGEPVPGPVDNEAMQQAIMQHCMETRRMSETHQARTVEKNMERKR